MSKPLAEFFRFVHSSDVYDYGFGHIHDFLWTPPKTNFDWIVTNPPFNLAAAFALTAMPVTRLGVALLVRTAFLEGGKRHHDLFSRHEPSDILQFVERVPMLKGRLDRRGSTATAYCWIVWRKEAPRGTHFHWLPPCRKRLERDSDYPSEFAA